MNETSPKTEFPALQLADTVLTPKGVARWRSGHPWIFRGDVQMVEEDTSQEGVTRVKDPRGRLLGHALLSRESNITLRILTRDSQEPTQEWFRDRLKEAIAHRGHMIPGQEARRLVFAEADRLPGLVVDQFNGHVVAQFLSWGMDALTPMWVDFLKEALNPESILARNDASVRRLEGMEREVKSLYGETPPTILYQEGKLIFETNLRTGQKTGAFLDQVPNHALAGRLAKGRVLDCFSYLGGFGLACAENADEVTCIDVSKEAVKNTRANAERNKLTNVTAIEGNTFDFLRARDKSNARYDMIILDPPAFAKNKQEIKGALRGYKEINLRAMKLLNPGGVLFTCSCSYHIDDVMFDAVLATAGADAKRIFRLTASPDQAADHPMRLGFPESRYLKTRVLTALD